MVVPDRGAGLGKGVNEGFGKVSWVTSSEGAGRNVVYWHSFFKGAGSLCNKYIL